jgi:hypothetical protein
VLRETTSRGLCGVVCPSRTCATRDSVYYCCFYLFIQYRVLCVFITAGPSTKLFTWGVFITALCVTYYKAVHCTRKKTQEAGVNFFCSFRDQRPSATGSGTPMRGKRIVWEAGTGCAAAAG